MRVGHPRETLAAGSDRGAHAVAHPVLDGRRIVGGVVSRGPCPNGTLTDRHRQHRPATERRRQGRRLALERTGLLSGAGRIGPHDQRHVASGDVVAQLLGGGTSIDWVTLQYRAHEFRASRGGAPNPLRSFVLVVVDQVGADRVHVCEQVMGDMGKHPPADLRLDLELAGSLLESAFGKPMTEPVGPQQRWELNAAVHELVRPGDRLRRRGNRLERRTGEHPAPDRAYVALTAEQQSGAEVLIAGSDKLRNRGHQQIGHLLRERTRPQPLQHSFELLPNDRLEVRLDGRHPV